MEQTDARDVLRQIIVTYGRDVATDSRRLESLLRDLCGGNRREITLLISAARENVPGELTASSAASMPRDLLLSRLRSRLEENLSITSQAAQWAVESWALALDQIQPSSLTTHHLTSDRGAGNPNVAGQPPILDRPAAPSGPTTPNAPPLVSPAQPGFVQASQPGYTPAAQTPPVTPEKPGFAPANQPNYPQNQTGAWPPLPANPQTSYNPYNSQGMAVVQSKATLALILGIVGILTSWLCGLGLLASIPAWVFGSGELKAIVEGRLPASNKSQAQVGMILGIVGVVLAVAAAYYFIAVYKSPPSGS